MAEKDKIGKYKVLGKIGEGGMGKVYKAVHPTLKHTVILKQLSISSKKDLAQRFKREARIMIDFRNENIVQVYDHFREGACYYIAMEFVDGVSLEDLIKKKERICPMAALLIVSEVAKGLKYAHDKGVVHRDIKPDNVLISKGGEVKLVDFGIATARKDNEDDITQTGTVMGTPAYMSPEQLASTKNVDKRSDIYSLGVMFYKMVTGVKPFPSNFTAEAIHSITRGVYDKPEKVNPDTPRLFKHIIKKTMNHKLNRRYKDLKYLLKLTSKYLARYKDHKEVNQALHDYVMDKKTDISLEDIPLKKKTNPWLKFFSTFILFSILGLTGFVLYNQGLYHEFFLGKTYGSLEIRTLIPKTYYKKPGFIYAFAELQYIGEDIKKETLKYSFNLNPYFDLILFTDEDTAKIKKKNTLLTTNKVYLPAGRYTLDLIIENNKIVQTFYLNPRIIQKDKTYKTYERRLLQFSFKEILHKSLSVKHDVKDSVTGKSILSNATILLSTSSGWKDWKKEYKKLSESIKTGNKLTFKYDVKGYYSQTMTFPVEANMDTLICDINLIQIPGMLILTSNAKGLEIEIDGRKENYIGGQEKSFIKYGTTIEGKKEFQLMDGKYSLTIKREGVTQSFQFKINQEMATYLKITYDKNTKVIEIIEGK